MTATEASPPRTDVLPDWHHAWGEPLFPASIRRTPSDFLVDEQLEIEFSGDGEHDFLHIRKTSCNTGWVAGRLARHAGVRDADVGYSGRKDRHAVTTQWFSVPARDADWSSFAEDGVEILDVQRHRRKLRTGTHRSNRFRIALRSTGLSPHRSFIDERLQHIADGGVPNYFGPQRFGHDGGNLDLARHVFEGKRLSRNRRNIAVSAARSFLFNEILSSRVAAGSWNRILPGELANLDGSGSVFRVGDIDSDLERRCAEMDIHPSGVLFGTGDDGPGGAVAAIEYEAVSPHDELTGGLERLRVEASRRALRVRISDLDWQLEDDALWLEFTLPKGAFATSVLREIADCGPH
jgi:tRNA pseudouridine13 synthase